MESNPANEPFPFILTRTTHTSNDKPSGLQTLFKKNPGEIFHCLLDSGFDLDYHSSLSMNGQGMYEDKRTITMLTIKKQRIVFALAALLFSVLFVKTAASNSPSLPYRISHLNPYEDSAFDALPPPLSTEKDPQSDKELPPRTEPFQSETRSFSNGLPSNNIQAMPCIGPEEFEGVFPPEGWSQYKTGDSVDPGWQQTALYAHSGSYSAYHNDDDLSGPAISWLVTPAFTVTEDSILSFWQNIVWVQYYNYHGVWISNGSSDPNAGDYVELAKLVPTEDNEYAWIQEQIDLGSYAGQSVYLAFRYKGDYDSEWYLDDISITGCGLAPGLHFYPEQLETLGCSGLTQTHQVNLANWTGAGATILLDYQTTNPSYGSIVGPESLTLPNGTETTIAITITPNLCLPDSLQLTGSVEAVANGYTGTLQILKTVHTGLNSEWQPVSNTPQGTRFHAVAYYNDGLYQIGGEIGWWTLTDSVYHYDFASESWSASANMITGAYGIDAAVIGGLVYVPGGNVSGVDANLAGPRLDSLQIYSPGADSWSLGTPMPAALAYASSVALDGKLYVIGGEDAAALYANTLYEYDPSNGNWQQKASLSQARAYALAAAVGDKIYVTGGFDGTDALHTTEIYNPSTNSWTAGPDLPKDWAAYAGGALGDRYFLVLNGDIMSFDGSNTSYSCSTDAFVLDTVLNEWSAIDPLSQCLYGSQGDGNADTYYLVSGRSSEGIWHMATEAESFQLCPVCELAGYLEGRVTDYNGTDPVCTAAALAIEPGGMVVAANADGTYITALPPLDYSITASATNYPTVSGPTLATISDGVVTHLDFTLDRPDSIANPTSITATAFLSATAAGYITISNQGSYTLTFQTLEIPVPTETREAVPFHQEQRSAYTAGVQVEDALQNQFDRQGQAGFMIVFDEQPDLAPALSMDWDERGRYVANALEETAERSQANVRAFLDENGIAYRPFWIENVIVVGNSDRETFIKLQGFNEITSLNARRIMQLIEPETAATASRSPASIEPNISHVGADQVWQLGIRGENMVVANIDTGVRYTHQTLVDHYRGSLGGGSFSHDYNWLDPTSGALYPTDDHGHGTHTMGIMLGDDGGSNQIGMAPGAEWIACDACDTYGCFDDSLLTCAQWVIAPYPIGQPSQFDPDLRPQVVNNSWGDCSQVYDGWFQDAVDAWQAAGVYPVFSNGNASNCDYSSPPGLNTVGNPARYGNVTGVGSTGQSNGLYASHSNWGPTDDPDTVNPNGYPYLKPQVVAPGVYIRSSLNGTDSAYGSWSGTSMSAPHVAGLVALMWQAGYCLVGDYATTETLIEQTANPIPYATGNGDEGPGDVPNHATGWGEIDAAAAVRAAINYCDPNRLEWVAANPASGVLVSGEQQIELSFTCDMTASLETQPLRGSLFIDHNDPCQDTFEVGLNFYCLHQPPVAGFSAGPTSGPAPLAVDFTNTSSGEYQTCLWRFGDGDQSSACSGLQHVYQMDGVYTVSLSVEGPGGSDTLTRTNYITTYLLALSGAVDFWQGRAGIAGALLTLSGDATYTETTAAGGAFSLSGVRAGEYVLTPSRSDPGAGISSLDASLVLRHDANLITLDGYPLLAGDVNKSGAATAMDAYYILQQAAGLLPLPFPGAGQVWQFDPSGREYTNLQNSLTGQDFTGILLGDVSGNWQPSASKGAPAQATLSLPSAVAHTGTVITVPLVLDLPAGQLYGADIDLTFDPLVLRAVSVSAGGLANNWTLAGNLQSPGLIRVAMAGAAPIETGGVLLVISFQVAGDPACQSPLTFIHASLNEGGIGVNLIDGLLQIVGWDYQIYLPVVIR